MARKPSKAMFEGQTMMPHLKVPPWMRRKAELSVKKRQNYDPTYCLSTWQREAYREKLEREFGEGLKSPDRE